jgi:hypothetical protein
MGWKETRGGRYEGTDASDPNGDWTMRTLLEAELAPGERILWTGRPSLRRKLDGGTIYCLVAALIWIPLFGWYSIGYMQLLDFAPIPFAAVYILILAIVFLEGTIGFPLMRFWYQRHTGYALTDRRILELVTDAKGAKKRFRSDAIELVADERVRLSKDGSGTLEFGKYPMFDWMYHLPIMPRPEIIRRYRVPFLSFVEIEDCEAVHQQFRMARGRIRSTGDQPG